MFVKVFLITANWKNTKCTTASGADVYTCAMQEGLLRQHCRATIKKVKWLQQLKVNGRLLLRCSDTVYNGMACADQQIAYKE